MIKATPITCTSFVFAVLCLGASTAGAQEPIKQVELTAEQIELNNKATSALNEKKYEIAVDYMRAAIRDRGVPGQRGNLLFLTLGRALQLQDRCEEAEEQFAIAAREPQVVGVPPDFVPKKLKEYRDETPDICSAHLTIECVDANARISINQAAPEALCGKKLPLPSGAYRIHATVSAGTPREQDLERSLVGGQHETIQITLKQTIIKTRETIPTSAIITGASTIVLAGGLWGYTAYARSQGENAYNDYKQTTTPRQADEKEVEVRQWESRARLTNRIAIGVAVVGVATTTALIFWPRQEEQPMLKSLQGDTTSTAWSSSLWAAPGSFGLGAFKRW